MKISQTRNYTQFVHDSTNRPITERDATKLKLLRASMQKYGFLPFPVIVRRSGDRLRIIDGQHRFAVAQELGLPVLWVETDRDDIVIAETAAAQSPWQLFHYVASFAAQGHEEYKRLLEFAGETGLPLQRSASLLFGEIAAGSNVNPVLKAGKFRIRDMAYARRVAAIVDVVRKHVPWALHSNSITAISRFARVKEFDDAHLMKKIETHPHMLRRCASLELFCEMYEEIYNYSSRQRLPLAFLAREVCLKRSNLAEMKRERLARARADANAAA